MKASNSIRLLAWFAILVTLGFGLRPFNFYSRNDVAFDPETSSLIFHGQSEQRHYWQRGIAYTNDPFFFASESPFTIVFQLTPSRWPLGQGTILELDDNGIQPPLILAQWKNHLVIRSRRSEGYQGRPYREMGVSNIFEKDTTINLAINYDGERTGVFVNGKLAESRPYQLVESRSSVTARLVMGNNATGELPWFGSLSRFALYNRTLGQEELDEDPHSATLSYRFTQRFIDQVPNLASIDAPLFIPRRFQTPDSKRFTPIGTLNDPEKRQTYDMAINLFGFLPAGFAIAILLNRRMGNRLTLMLSAALLSSALSFAIELLQVHLPTRDPSYIDFAINSFAGTIAATCAALTLRKNARKKPQSSIHAFRF